MNKLKDAPPTLMRLFPDISGAEEKAWKFLDVHYECGNKILTTTKKIGEVYGIFLDNKTTKNLYEFLMDTEVYQRFQASVVKDTKDFFSTPKLVRVYEEYERELSRANDTIRIAERNKERDIMFSWSKHKKSLLDRMADIILTIRGNTSAEGVIHQDHKSKDDAKRYDEILKESEEFNNNALDS